METIVGSALVLGAGISGIRSALDLALLGHRVILVEKAPHVGGTLIQLDRQFPNDFCGICRMLPMVERQASSQYCLRRGLYHENIDIRLSAELVTLEGGPGNFTAVINQKALMVDPGKCIGCGACARVCQVRVPDAFNTGLAWRKAIYLPVPYSLPNTHIVDREACTRCGECLKVCPTAAIDLDETDRQTRVQVGAIVLATGFGSFDPRDATTPYAVRQPNVVTSIEFERMLGGLEPGQGRLFRPGDGKPVNRIAWLQCVGSRDLQAKADFCSSACCMFSIKEAVMTKQCLGRQVDTAIFYMDMRTFGKSFQRYRDQAETDYQVRFERCRVHSVCPSNQGRQLGISYLNETGKLSEENFDLVVLATGQRPPAGNEELARIMGVEVNSWGFYQPRAFSTNLTSREGIYVGGAALGLKDISESIIGADAAALAAAAFLSKTRPALPRESRPPTLFRDITEENPQVDIVLCTCDDFLAETTKIDYLTSSLADLSGVGRVILEKRVCTRQGWDSMGPALKTSGGNRILVCACETHLYADKLMELGQSLNLDPFLIQMIDIRSTSYAGQNGDQQDRTGEIRAHIAAGVGKLMNTGPAILPAFSVHPQALVVGGGIAGLTAALAIADQGYAVDLVEKSTVLGGNLRLRHHTLEGYPPRKLLTDTVTRVMEHQEIRVHLGARVRSSTGYMGNFITEIERNGAETDIVRHGVTILASGGQEARTDSYLHGQNPSVFTQGELEEGIRTGAIKPDKLKAAGMIQCVGSREEPRNYCSRICCASALKNALYLKEQNPDIRIYIFYRDMMSFGFMESYFTEARKKGVTFIRYDKKHQPVVRAETGRLRISTLDPILNHTLDIEVDLLALATGVIPSDNRELEKIFGADLDQDGFFEEIDPKWRPVETKARGVFACGLAHSPRSITESVSMAEAAAQKALRFLSKARLSVSHVFAAVDRVLCTGCKTCQDLCPFKAVSFSEEQKQAHINVALCQGCGICAAACPVGAILVQDCHPRQMFAQIEGMLS